MPNKSIKDQTEYLTRILLESKDLSKQTPESLVKLYKETYEKINNSLKDYNNDSQHQQKVYY